MNQIDLEQAIIEINKPKVNFGITFEELKGNKVNHNKVFFDHFGIPWKWMKGTLYYNNAGYKKNIKGYRGWDEAYTESPEINIMKFFTPEQFEKIKPSYL